MYIIKKSDLIGHDASATVLPVSRTSIDVCGVYEYPARLSTEAIAD
ncbi:MAG: hypothetical protein H6981_06130 [Gammaproteobacteria bacterium]|nr:hypothetical protein [Gammaproteobacteria bacterium]MCP5136361.1 hypothetical protein [Gammaproteobacteria bacterium]